MKRVLIVLDDNIFEKLSKEKERQKKTWEELLIDPYLTKEGKIRVAA